LGGLDGDERRDGNSDKCKWQEFLG